MQCGALAGGLSWSWLFGQVGSEVKVYSGFCSCCQNFNHIERFLLLLGLWGCGQGVSLVHHIHRLPDRVNFRWRPAVKGRVRPGGIVEADPLDRKSVV